MIARVVFHYVKNWADAEDIMQEVLLKYANRHKSFENDEHIKAWLIRVAINMARNHLNTAWHKKVTSFEDNKEYVNSRTISETHGTVLEVVFTLPPKYRSVIYLYYFEGYKINEIASILKKNEHTIQTWLQRGRNRLKMEMECFTDESQSIYN